MLPSQRHDAHEHCGERRVQETKNTRVEIIQTAALHDFTYSKIISHETEITESETCPSSSLAL